MASGRWESSRGLLPTSRRYVDRAPGATEQDRRLLRDTPAAEWTPADAAVAVLALVAGLLAVSAEPATLQILLSRTTPARWLCEAVTEHLAAVKARNSWTAAVLGAGGVGPF